MQHTEEQLQDLQKKQSLLAWVPQNYTTKVFPRTITPESFVVLQVLAEINVLECAKKTENRNVCTGTG